HCILAVPQFVAARLLNDAERQEQVKQHIRYVPWMVANLLVNNLEERSGAQPGWDNVLHGNETLGYVDASHQLLQQHTPKRNLSCYLPLTETDTVTERKKAQQVTFEAWAERVFAQLEKVHPNIRTATEEINIMLWGHAMAQPVPGWVHGAWRKQLAEPINNRVFFAHTDVAGISIFEEAFYQGITAAQKITGAPK
ncbi:MAG: FAD-dependent oxidoreductase, partial [Dinghuibacter sp.]|nr:FAD-dependent oxidoreductase [Dinghuibacter sp.]